MSRSTPMKPSRISVRQHSTGFELMVIGTSFKISQLELDESSKVLSSRQTRIPVRKTSTSSSQTRSRAKSLPASLRQEEIDSKPLSLTVSTEKTTDSNPQTESENKTEVERCAICLDDHTVPKQLDKCSHIFCTDCIDAYFQNVKPQCPCCFTIYGEIRGNQPEGEMKVARIPRRLPGYGRNSTGTIQITYIFPDGVQDDKHPNPGVPYYGTVRDAFLPDNTEGQEVLKLLERSFDLRQTFTIGQSRTTGCDNVVTWNDIHHKTSTHGGMENFGYPDHTYLNRVRQELAAKGIK